MLQQATKFDFIPITGEMATLIREKDWSKTAVGTPDQWPQSLRTILGVVLHSRFPMFIFWGPELTCFYNDAYRPSLGKEGKHPAILGQPGEEVWPEIWSVIHPLIEQVLNGGEATWSEDQLIPIYRNGMLEDVYWTFSYSCINNDQGKANGVLVTCVETTQKIFNQRRLEETADLLQFSTDAAQLGTWDYNPRTGKFIGNDKLKNWFGLHPGEETEISLAIEAIASKDRERVVAAIDASLDYKRQSPYDIQYTIINRVTGQETVVLVRGKAYFDESNTAYRFSGTMEDITEDDFVDKLRMEAEENLRNMIEQAPVAMCVLKGSNHVVAIANDMMIRLWGKESVQVMNKPIFEGLPEAKGQGLEELLDNVYKTGERFTAKERPVNLPRPDGIETIYQNFVYEPLRDANGNIGGVIAITIDVTEQVTARLIIEGAEERARLAVAAGNLGTFDLEIEQRKAIISDRFCEIFDVTRDSAHQALVERIHPDDIGYRNKAVNEAMETGHLHYEVRIVHRNGNIRWVRADGKFFKSDDAANKPARMIGTVMDITDHKEMERKREEYIAIASHELKNPLTSLKLALDMLSSLVKEPGSGFFLNKSRDQVNRLISLSSELLNVSKISSGVLEINPEVFDLGTAITDSIHTVEGGVSSDLFNVSGNTDISVLADRFRIEQVLINLLSNAVKYSPKGSPVYIDVENEPGWVKVSVRDKGIGIDEDKIPLVFQKFSRLETSRGIDGYGLGLYITEQIIRRHGGEIGVESQKGKGSTFWFKLPH